MTMERTMAMTSRGVEPSVSVSHNLYNVAWGSRGNSYRVAFVFVVVGVVRVRKMGMGTLEPEV